MTALEALLPIAVGLVAAAYIRKGIRWLQRRQAAAHKAALIADYLARKYPATLTKSQCDEMDAARWD